MTKDETLVEQFFISLETTKRITESLEKAEIRVLDNC